ncbi:MAG: UDP-N-acetylmuramate dehydrogenase [Candidatus Omnitrophica bacterium]|nr:UDP-N-acetylmuramate dehydrogenase [Candidatus Omnitrophota bacterium]
MNDSVKKMLENTFGKRVVFDTSAKDFTTFKTGGPLSAVVFPSRKEEIEFLFELEKKGTEVKFIGRGSNLLISDHGFDGVIAATGKLSDVCLYENFVSGYCGTKISSLIGFCIMRSRGGLEFLSGIPGTIGGALINNAGIKETNISDVVEQIQYMDKGGNWIRSNKIEIAWNYRYSQLKEKAFFVLSCTLRTERNNREKIKENISAILKQRKEKQPLEYPSAGSVFKNPEGLFAGKLIEEAGLKGSRIGGAMISEKHANFIINTGNASSLDIWNLMKFIQEKVNNRYNILLKPEIELIGRFP